MEGKDYNPVHRAQPKSSLSQRYGPNDDLLSNSLDDPFLAPYLLKADHNQPPSSGPNRSNLLDERASILANSSLDQAPLQEFAQEAAPTYHCGLDSSNGLTALSFLEENPSVEGKENNPVHHVQPQSLSSLHYGAVVDLLPDSLDDAMLAPYLHHANHNQRPSSNSNSSLDPARLQKPAHNAAQTYRPLPLLPAMHRSTDNQGLESIRINGVMAGNRFTKGRARSQAGSKFLSGGEFFEMETMDEEQVDATLRKLADIDRLKEMMTHPMASKVFHKLVVFCCERSRLKIPVSFGWGDAPLLQVCRNADWMYSVKKLPEYLDTENHRYFAAVALSSLIATLSKDAHGQRVIEFCLKNFLYEECWPILVGIAENLVEIATDLTGCRMLSTCIQLLKGFHRDYLCALIAENSLQLALDPHGNFLVQELLELETPRVTAYVLRHLEGNYHLLSTDKYGSHVVETCLKRSRREQFEMIVSELMKGRDFTELFVHPFGNYIVQSILSVAKGWGLIYDDINIMIETRHEKLRSNPYGSNVLKRLRRPQQANEYKAAFSHFRYNTRSG